MRVQAVTISVSNFDVSKQFYEEILGFEPDSVYERWQSYKCQEFAFFAIIEKLDLVRPQTLDIINFVIPDVNAFWTKIKDKVQVETPPTRMPWGSYKIVVLDPDGYRIGFLDLT